MNLTTGIELTNNLTVHVTAVPHDRMRFDVKIEGMDVVQQTRLGREALRIVLAQFKATGRLQVKNVELSVPSAVERTMVCERAEAVMREEIL